ncbi:MAG: hypothetical protein U1E49_10140 [Hyphomicrobiaceae bacterium]
MTATIKQLKANRANASVSTGPVTATGKAIASRNATRHGLLSSRLLFQGEDAEAFEDLLTELGRSLRPSGTAECALVERIGITLWRQRRLVGAESAALELAQLPQEIAHEVNATLTLRGDVAVDGDDLEPFPSIQLEWCNGVIQEAAWAQPDMPLSRLSDALPLTYAQLKDDADEAELSVEQFLTNTENGLEGYARELASFCRKELEAAERRPRVLEIADVVRQRRLVLPSELLELFSRYQTTLDNQLIRLLKALRQAQSWRLETIEPCNTAQGPADNAAE